MANFVYLGGWFGRQLTNLFTAINTTIYKFVGWLYEVFMYIAGARIIQSNQIEPLIHRLQMIIGVVMLFITAFTVIKSIIDPDKEAKNVSNIYVKIITSIIILAIFNTAFNYLYEAQKEIMKSNVIGKVILGTTDETSCKLEDAGFCMATDTLASFYEEVAIGKSGEDAKELNEICFDSNGKGIDKLPQGAKCYYKNEDGAYASKEEIIKYIKSTNNMTNGFLFLSNAVDEGAIDFSWFLALICGLYMVYIFISFCFDLAVRAVKLALLQTIGPIPIIARIIPNQDSIFNNWVKKTVTTFMEVFIKIAIIFFGVYLILMVDDLNFGGGYMENVSSSAAAIAKVMLVLGILMFVKQAPGFISEIFGIKSDNMKIGIKDKLTSAGVFAAGAGVGAGVTSAVRNYRDTYNKSKANGHGRLRSGWSGVRSSIAGAASGAGRGVYRGRNAQNVSDMRTAASGGAQAASERRDARDERQNQYGRFSGIKSSAEKFKESFKNWAGNDQSEYLRLNKRYEDLDAIKGRNKAFNDWASTTLDKHENEVNVASFTWTDINGNSTTSRNANIGILRKELNMMKTTGKDSYGNSVGTVAIANAENMLKAAEKQAKKDLKNGTLNNVLSDGEKAARVNNLRDVQTAILDHGDSLAKGSKTKVDTIEKVNVKSASASEIDSMLGDITSDINNQMSDIQFEMYSISERNKKKNDK